MKKRIQYFRTSQPPALLQDKLSPMAPTGDQGVMLRTQIYLTREEHGFVSAEAARRGEPMAAVIRAYIDEKMRLPESAWSENPMLDPTPVDKGLQLPEDAAINHDHYLYGTPKKYARKRGRWELASPKTEA